MNNTSPNKNRTVAITTKNQPKSLTKPAGDAPDSKASHHGVLL
jgi:hypothetical protein